MRRTARGAVLLAVALTVLLAVPAQAAPPDRSSGPMYVFGDEAEIDSTNSTLNRRDNGVSMNIRTRDLDPGHTYTVWWVIFNNPDACVGACSGDDLENDEAGPAMGYAAGNVVGNSGRSGFGSSLKVDDGTGFAFGMLTNPRGAEIHLVVRDHGPLNPEWMPDQIKTFGGGCDQDHGSYPEDMQGAGVAGDYVCSNAQVSIHMAD
jgi:hypothetical protein